MKSNQTLASGQVHYAPVKPLITLLNPVRTRQDPWVSRLELIDCYYPGDCFYVNFTVEVIAKRKHLHWSQRLRENHLQDQQLLPPISGLYQLMANLSYANSLGVNVFSDGNENSRLVPFA